MQPTFLQQQHRQHRRSSSSNCEKDDYLLLFSEMQERERAASSHEPLHRAQSKTAVEEEDIFSSSEWDQHDYDWLMVSPATPPILTPDHYEPFNNGFASSGSPSMYSPKPKGIGRLGSSRAEPCSAGEPVVPAVHRTHNSQDPSRPLTPPMSSTSRKSSSSSLSPIAATDPLPTPARSSTPISRPIARPSTPTKSASGATPQSSTPIGRSTAPSNRAMSTSARSSTPIKRPATPTRGNNPSSSSGKITSSASKQSMLPSKSTSSSWPSSPAAGRTRQSTAHPAVVIGTLQEKPSNLRVDRPLSNPRGSAASRTNLATASVKPTQPEPADGGARTKRPPSSSLLVSRGRLSSEALNGSSKQRTVKAQDVPKVSASSGAGSKMVDRSMPPRKPIIVSKERVLSEVNPQAVKVLKPAPAVHDAKIKAQVRDSTGYGRNLPKKTVDMALKHMDIRGSDTSSFQSFMSNVSTSSLYSVRSRTGRGTSSSSIASSPMATSSITSSEHGRSFVIDPESSEYFDETSSDMGSRASSVSHADSIVPISHERKVSHWLASPGFMDDTSADVMQIFDGGLASLSSPESPLISQQEGVIGCDDFALEPI